MSIEINNRVVPNLLPKNDTSVFLTIKREKCTISLKIQFLKYLITELGLSVLRGGSHLEL